MKRVVTQLPVINFRLLAPALIFTHPAEHFASTPETDPSSDQSKAGKKNRDRNAAYLHKNSSRTNKQMYIPLAKRMRDQDTTHPFRKWALEWERKKLDVTTASRWADCGRNKKKRRKNEVIYHTTRGFERAWATQWISNDVTQESSTTMQQFRPGFFLLFWQLGFSTPEVSVWLAF